LGDPQLASIHRSNLQPAHFILQRGDNIKRLRREANAEVVIEDFVLGSEERVLSVVLHRDAPHHTSTSGGDALVCVFEAFCELSRDCLTANNSSEEVDTHTNGSDGDAQMTITGIHDDEDAEIRLLVDSSRKFYQIRFCFSYDQWNTEFCYLLHLQVLLF